mgnify:CR=1 FL=1
MEKNVITVNKTASESYPANRVSVSVTAFGESKKYAAAVDAAEARAGDVIMAFSKLDGVQLVDCGVNVNAVRDGGKTSGYRASRTFSAEFDFDRKLLEKTTDALVGADVEWRVSFGRKDCGEREALLAKAVESAKNDASVLAQAAGVKLGKLVYAEYSSDDGARPMLLRAARYSDGATEPERITVSQSVSCSWEIA